ncbi:DUF106 domain-containing protein [archaeon]|jgi:uncharacterized membrane protein (DUF106 family)|nr:DUF106 domain-containing protein [archaeon]
MGFLDVLLGWVLYLHPALGIMVISLIVSLIITLAIRVFTDQSLMKDLRAELKELQAEMKELKNNPKKMSKINDRFMETNMKYMSQSMRPTLFTFIPIILVFGWLQAHIAYYPILPEEPFRLSAEFIDEARGKVSLILPEGLTLLEGDLDKEILHKEVEWVLSGGTGEYEVELLYQDKAYKKDILITNQSTYAQPEKSFKKKVLFFSSNDQHGLNFIRLSNDKILPFIDVPVIKDIPWVGSWGWFGTYFLFSLFFSMSLRKLFKIH